MNGLRGMWYSRSKEQIWDEVYKAYHSWEHPNITPDETYAIIGFDVEKDKYYGAICLFTLDDIDEVMYGANSMLPKHIVVSRRVMLTFDEDMQSFTFDSIVSIGTPTEADFRRREDTN